MANDSELLRSYAQKGSEEAFTEVVQRHLGFVYHTALRQVNGNAHLAEEAAQNVFIDLGRKAEILAERPVLTGWLYVSSVYAAAKLARTAQRRKRWEMEASTMEELSADQVEIEWQRIRPDLDELLLRLTKRDREAILLRYFEGLRLSEMAQKLSLTEDGARLRVDRALQRMHSMFARRGIYSSETMLAAAFASQGRAAAPGGLANKLAGVAFNHLGASGGATSNFILWNFMTTSKIVVSAICALVLVGVVAVVEVKHSSSYRQRFRTGVGNGSLSQPRADRHTTSTNKRSGSTMPDLTQNLITSPSSGSNLSAKKANNRNGKVLSYLDAGVIPITSLANVGCATPRASMESFVWACAHGTKDDIAPMLTLSADARAKLNAILEILPDTVRTQYPDVEHLMAVSAAFEGTVVPTTGNIEIVSESINPAGDTTIAFHMATDQPAQTNLDPKNVSRVTLRNGPNGWMNVVPDYAVNKFAQSIVETGKVGH